MLSMHKSKVLNLLKAVSLLLLIPKVLAEGTLNMVEGDSKVIKTGQEIATVFISDPKIANYQIIDKHRLVIYARGLGKASVIVFDKNDQSLVSHSIVVSRSLSDIKNYLNSYYSDFAIKIFNVGDRVVLAGEVDSQETKDTIADSVALLLGKSVSKSKKGIRTTKSYAGLVNYIKVAVIKQVNVKLSIAEVSQSFLEDIGIKHRGKNSIDSNQKGTGIFVDTLKQLGKLSAGDILSTITAVGVDSVGEILAEPNLSVISGESASFLVGGEIPVVTSSGNGSNVSYKEFGIRLSVSARVKRDNKILLALKPEVSSVDTEYTKNDLNIPALKTRRAETTVQLADGESFVLGGLIDSQSSEQLSKVPFISKIPILGALFRQTGSRNSKRELIIVATVNLVKPLKAEQVQLPKMVKSNIWKRLFSIQPKNIHDSKNMWVKDLLSSGGFKK